ncbi:MAG: hypothetical protein HC875_31630 [Anaerolineales bacterium]|nr:hypothetical protein [Anaerolineales bacterium]
MDGQPAALGPVTERGLIGVTVPAGQHRLRLFFSETPVRRVANTISTLALFIAAGLGFKAIYDLRFRFARLWRIYDLRLAIRHSPFAIRPQSPAYLTLLTLAFILLLTKNPLPGSF